MLRYRSRKDAQEAGVLRERENAGHAPSRKRGINRDDPLRGSGDWPEAEPSAADPAPPRVPRRKRGNRLPNQRRREELGEPLRDTSGAFELDFAPTPVFSMGIGLAMGHPSGSGSCRTLLSGIPLPLGPSINAYWSERIVWSAEKKRHFPIRYTTHEGKAYQQYIRELMLERKAWFRSENALYLRILCCFPDERGRDLDNVVKVLQDSLMNAHVFVSDTQVKRLEVREGPRMKPGVVFVSLQEILPDKAANLAWIKAE